MNSLCVLPFVQFNNELGGECRPCCVNTGTFGNTRTHRILEAWNSEGWRELRRAFAAGERPESCRYCWEQEELWIESYRLQNNRWNGPLLDLRPEVFDRRTGQLSAPPRNLVLKPSNLCNLACRMCSPGVSTSVNRAWDAELEELSGHARAGLARNFPDPAALLAELRELGPSLQQISFGGGEPLCDPTVREVLVTLRPWAHRIQTHANTNLSRLQHGDLDVLAQMTSFRSCVLTVSVDGPPGLHGYIRPGLDVGQFLQNLERVRGLPRLELDCNIAVQLLNVLRLPETLDFVLRAVRPGSVLMSLATGIGSEHLDVRTLPVEVKAVVSRRLQGFAQAAHSRQYPTVPEPLLAQVKSMAEQVERFMTSADLWTARRWERVAAFYRKLDGAHGTSLHEAAPELAALLGGGGGTVSVAPVGDRLAGAEAADGPSRPLLHLPAHVPYSTPSGERAGTRQYVLELLLASLHSLQHRERRHDVLVTSNDAEILEVAGRLRAAVGARWELQSITPDETMTTFRVDRAQLVNEACAKFIYTKFHPVFRRAAPWIVHLDIDTMFMGELDFGAHGAAGISLVDANRLAGWPPWRPDPGQAEFFGLRPDAVSRWSWLNAGVISLRGVGLERCQAGIEHYLANLDRAVQLGVTANGDEVMFNALAVRDGGAVSVHPDHNDNLLAYFLPHARGWRRTARIVHFHALKPNVLRYANGDRLIAQPTPALASRVTPDFCLAGLLWARHLHAAARAIGLELPIMRQLPAPLVERDIERFAALVEPQAVPADGTVRRAGGSGP